MPADNRAKRRYTRTAVHIPRRSRGFCNKIHEEVVEFVVFPEIPEYDLVRVCRFGSLPPVYLSEDPIDDLQSYCGNYLKEEIQAEGVVRRIENFSRFLEIAALTSGDPVNIESRASDTGVSASTLREYMQILEDTRVGSFLKPCKKAIHRKSVSTAKFYLFDVGVSNVLAQRYAITEKPEQFGKAFEHCIYNEIRAFLAYTKDNRQLTYWRDRHGHEVDFIIGDDTCIEVKSTAEVVTNT